jgi:hypothetical protein
MLKVVVSVVIVGLAIVTLTLSSITFTKSMLTATLFFVEFVAVVTFEVLQLIKKIAQLSVINIFFILTVIFSID